jgi:hypothetical protein
VSRFTSTWHAEDDTQQPSTRGRSRPSATVLIREALESNAIVGWAKRFSEL